MCRTQTLTYACSHSMKFVLSTCGGSFTYLGRKQREKRVSCVGGSLITRRVEGVCGGCARRERERELNEGIVALKKILYERKVWDPEDWGAEIPEEVTVAEAKKDDELYILHKRFPDGSFKKSSRPEKGSGATRRPTAERKSVLSKEVRPEDVVLKLDINKFASSGGWEDWGEDYVRLEDEVAENAAAQEAAGITVCWGPWTGQGEGEHEESERRIGVGWSEAGGKLEGEMRELDGVVVSEKQETILDTSEKTNEVAVAEEHEVDLNEGEKTNGINNEIAQLEGLAVCEKLAGVIHVPTSKETEPPMKMATTATLELPIEYEATLDVDEETNEPEDSVAQVEGLTVYEEPTMTVNIPNSKENEPPMKTVRTTTLQTASTEVELPKLGIVEKDNGPGDNVAKLEGRNIRDKPVTAQCVPSPKENELPKRFRTAMSQPQRKPHLVRRKRACDDLRSLRKCNTFEMKLTVGT